MLLNYINYFIIIILNISPPAALVAGAAAYAIAIANSNSSLAIAC
jgi:hypothetical protein